MIKDLTCILTDLDTGEILLNSKQLNERSFNGDYIYIHRWFECFKRGYMQGKNLNLSISVDIPLNREIENDKPF